MTVNTPGVPHRRRLAVAGVALVAGGAGALVARRRRRPKPRPDRIDRLDRFPIHRELRNRAYQLARALLAQRSVRSAWDADGQPLEQSDAIAAANEEVIARLFELDGFAERADELLGEEREYAEDIGPTTVAALDHVSGFARRVAADAEGGGMAAAGSGGAHE